jgi:tight adherence protein B
MEEVALSRALSHVPLADALALPGGIGILLGVLVGGGIALLFVGLQRVIDGRTNTLSRRLDQYAVGVPVAPPPQAKIRIRGARRHAPNAAYTAFENVAATRGFSVTLARDLARADLRITVGEYLVLTVVLASIGTLLGLALPFSGRILLALVLLVAGILGPRYYVTWRKTRRQRAFDGQLADVTTLMAGALRSGYSFLQAMELVAREGPAPVSTEFDRVVREVGLGLSPEEALANLVDRMESEDLELMVTAINVQRDVGGNLVEVLDIIANTIRERVKLVGEVRVLTSQQGCSGNVIALLPVVLGIVLAIINPTYILGVFRTTTYCGWTMVSCSVIMILSGYLVIRQIVNIRV